MNVLLILLYLAVACAAPLRARPLPHPTLQVIPFANLTKDTFARLGFHDVVSLNLSSEMVVPTTCKLALVSPATAHLDLPDLIVNSMPFQVPEPQSVTMFFAIPSNTTGVEVPLLQVTGPTLVVYIDDRPRHVSTFLDHQLPVLDSLASEWIRHFGVNRLVSSAFYTAGNTTSESYTLSIRNHLVYVQPAFAPTLRPGNIPLIQVATQIHDRLYNIAERFNDFTYDLVHDPKTLVKEKDKILDDKIEDWTDRLLERVESLKELPDRLEEKAEVWRGLADYSVDDHEVERTLEEVDEGKYNFDVYNRPSKREEPVGGVVSLQEVRTRLVEPRKTYSQVVFPKNPPCVPITWFNVFHHAVFEPTEFC